MLIETWAHNGILDAFRSMERLENQMHDIFRGRSFGFEERYPELSISTKDDFVKLTAFIPGSDADKIDVSAKGRELTISGWIAEEDENSKAYFRRERNHGKFSRTVRLPFNVNGDEIKANYSKGLLTITANRSEADKPKVIPVNQA